MEADCDRRTYFCEQMIVMLDNNLIQLEQFSGECTFTLHGHGNRQNCRHWSRKNPHWMREEHSQYSEKVNGCSGIVEFFIHELSSAVPLHFSIVFCLKAITSF